MATQRERMLAGELYMANDPELSAAYARAQGLLARLNATQGDDVEGLTRTLRDLLGHLGDDAVVKPSFRCDYGSNIRIGARSFVNYECLFLDCNTIAIGEEVQIAPGVHIYTASHPLDAATRRTGLESAHPVVIGDGVWLGGRSIVCPGVTEGTTRRCVPRATVQASPRWPGARLTIGENAVVGAGSVVTRDLPPNVLAVGSPCRVIRSL